MDNLPLFIPLTQYHYNKREDTKEIRHILFNVNEQIENIHTEDYEGSETTIILLKHRVYRVRESPQEILDMIEQIRKKNYARLAAAVQNQIFGQIDDLFPVSKTEMV